MIRTVAPHPVLFSAVIVGDGCASLKAEHPLIPRLEGQPVGFLARLGCPLRRGPDRRAVDALA